MLEIHDINGRLTTRDVWYTTDDYGTLWRFVVTEGGVRFWWDAIHETAIMKILKYTQWSQHVHAPMPMQHSGFLKTGSNNEVV
jgi:Zn/Cd-binding protein ZinT